MKASFAQNTVAFAACIFCLVWSFAASVASAQETRQIRIKLGNQVVTGSLNSSEAAKNFISMLPLTIEMDDHLRREKTGVIPEPLSERTPGSPTYELGDLGYWRPRNSFVIFYRQDGLTIPGPGIVRLGKIDSGIEIFDRPGTVEVTVELIK
jgi:hypothetical protein